MKSKYIRRVVWVEGFRRLTRGRRPGCRAAFTKNLACGHGLSDSNMDRQVVGLQGINSSRVDYNDQTPTRHRDSMEAKSGRVLHHTKKQQPEEQAAVFGCRDLR